MRVRAGVKDFRVATVLGFGFSAVSLERNVLLDRELMRRQKVNLSQTKSRLRPARMPIFIFSPSGTTV